jgi:hypothetical protein
MSRPSKPMAKNSNSKFTPRNNKQDIFSKLTKALELKADIKMQPTDVHKENPEQPN